MAEPTGEAVTPKSRGAGEGGQGWEGGHEEGERGADAAQPRSTPLGVKGGSGDGTTSREVATPQH
jgi:hypothetical protein